MLPLVGRGFALRACAAVLWLVMLACTGCTPVARLPALDAKEVASEQRREQIAQMRSYYAGIHRVDNVAFRLRVANRTFCKNRVSAQIGLYAVTPRSLPRRFRSFAAEALDLTWVRPTVISVSDGSPAAEAGIRDHDEIIALDGELISLTGTANWMGGWLKANGEKPVRVDLRRDGVDRTVTVTPVIACSIPVDYIVDDQVNAATSDKGITINSGIVALAKTDAQLATVIGHEMAHANLGHLNKGRVNEMIGFAGGLAIDAGLMAGGLPTNGVFTREFTRGGRRAFSVQFEREADYVGAYYVARAGFDLAGTEELWWAMGQANPASLRFAKTHPIAPVRFLQMRAVAAEIADKERRHLPLVPELKSAQASAE
ncbi:MAG: M48 family metalloprotease [Pseudolabrys sp.]